MDFPPINYIFKNRELKKQFQRLISIWRKLNKKILISNLKKKQIL